MCSKTFRYVFFVYKIEAILFSTFYNSNLEKIEALNQKVNRTFDQFDLKKIEQVMLTL